MAKDIRLKKFVQVLPSLPKRDINGNIIEDEFTEKQTLWGWFFPIEDYWTKTETQTKLNELEQKIYESIYWKETVNTYSDIATKYPNPKEGWTVSVEDTNTIYRYDDASKTWIKIFESSTELATESRNGLMSSVMVKKLNGIEEGANKYIHPSTHPGSMITEDDNHRWLTDTLKNKWNVLVSFPGFAGTGGYSGTSANAARYDHRHQTLTDLTLLKFVDNTSIDIRAEGAEWFKRITTVDSLIATDKKFLFQERQGSGNYVNLFGVDSNGDIYGGNGATKKVSFEGHKHAMSDITGLSLDWSAILNKPETATRWPSWYEVTSIPSTFTPSAHTQLVSTISDIVSDWQTLLKSPPSDYVTRWPSWDEVTGKPASFTPESHTHVWSQLTSIPTTASRWPSWDEVTGKPASFTPESHTHAWSQLTSIPETVSRWPSFAEVTSKPINANYAFGGNQNSITTAQFLTLLQNLGAFSNGFGVYRGSLVYDYNQKITDTGVGIIHLAGSTVEVIGNSISACTIRVTVPTTTRGGTTKRIYVYCNNGDIYSPGWFAVARTDELTWNSISDKPSTFTPSSHTHAMSDISGLSLAWDSITEKPETATRWPSWDEVTSIPSTFTPSAHTHNMNDIIDAGSIYINAGTVDRKVILTRIKNSQGYISRVALGLTNPANCYSPVILSVGTDDDGTSWVDYTFGVNGLLSSPAGTFATLSRAQTWTAYQDFTSGAGNSGSDMRFKTKLSDSIDNILDELLDIEIFPYVWNKEGEQKRNTFGVNATQLKTKQGIFEKIVHEREDVEKTEWVEYDRIGVLALKGLQEEVIQRREENKKLTKVLEVICKKIGINMNKILEEI